MLAADAACLLVAMLVAYLSGFGTEEFQAVEALATMAFGVLTLVVARLSRPSKTDSSGPAFIGAEGTVRGVYPAHYAAR